MFSIRSIFICFLCLLIGLNPLFISQAVANTPGSQAPLSDEVELLEVFGPQKNNEENIFELEQALKGEVTDAYLDTFRLLDIALVTPMDSHNIDIRALSVSTFDGTQLRQIANTRTNKFFRSDIPFEFDITLQNTRLYHYRGSVRVVGFVGQYLYFLPANARSKNELHFIDLGFFGADLGKTHPGTFRIPFKNAISPENIQNESGLVVNGEPVTTNAFKVYSDLQQLAFNATVNLSSLDLVDKAKYLTDQLATYFDRALDLTGQNLNERLQLTSESQKHVKEFVSDLQKKMSNKIDSRKQSLSAAENHEVMSQIQGAINQSMNLNEVETSIGENLKEQRKLLNRIAMMWSAFRIPQPNGSETILRSFGYIIGGFKHKNRAEFNEGLLNLIHNHSLRTKVLIATAIVVGASFPESLASFSYEALDITATVMGSIVGKGKDLALLGFEAAKATATGFNPFHFQSAYLSPSRIHKFFVGLTAITATLYVTLGIPFFITNTVLLVKDLVKFDYPRARAVERNFLQSLITAFVSRQERDKREHLETLSTAERKNQNKDSEIIPFTPEEDIEAEKIAKALQAQNSSVTMQKIKTAVSSMGVVLSSIGDGTIESLRRWSVGSYLLNLTDKYKIGPLRRALTHFMFGASSLTHAGVAYVTIWQSWFAIRSFMWTPSIAALTLSYPKYFKIVSNGNLANDINGGGRFRTTQWYYHLFDNQYLQALEAWEDKIIKVEQQIHRFALEESLKAVARYTQDAGELKEIYALGKPKTIEEIDGLSVRAKTFFRAYFYDLISRSIESYLVKVAETNGVLDSTLKTPIELKEELIHKDIEVDKFDLAEIVSVQSTNDLFNRAKERANAAFSMATYILNQKFRILSKLNPDNNRQVQRLQMVEKQIHNPQAMARAVRAMVATNVVDKPLELFLSFVCLAGITEGVLMPIQEEMFGPNSWFYLSRMVMLNGFVYGVITGVLADPWMKLQLDLLHEGSFGEVPTDAKDQSYLKWYRSKFLDKKNTFWANQKHYYKIIWSNIPAALTSYVLVNLVTLGRFDLDSYISLYLFTFFTPLSGFASKLEQAFELSSYYWLKDVPERFRYHPTVLGAYNRIVGVKRLWFNLYYKIYENIVGNFVTNFVTMKTSLFGPRSFVRIVFGSTPTEYVNGASTAASNATSDLPVVQRSIKFCARIFTNNYTDWLPKK